VANDRRKLKAQRHEDGKLRCAWCPADPLYVAYHDTEWGVPVRADQHLFEMLCLEGAQAGLSWITVLRKRETYRQAFDGFDAEKIARYNAVNSHSDAMSKDLKQKGFKFVGSTICYAFMQAVGIVNEHQRYCWAAG
jgi:3-methyladenine DNA glycosylase Tag